MMFRHATAPNNIAGEETRARLLEAATEVFLADGFRTARVQEIARRSGLRLSAINYHFGSKEGLYLAVLHHHVRLSQQHLPPDLPELSAVPLRTRLEFVIADILQLHLGQEPANQVPQLLMREMSNPTPALEEIIRQFTLPLAGSLQALFGEILGPAVPQVAVNRSVCSLLGQCAMYAQARAVVSGVDPAIINDKSLIPNTTRHITDFTWGGLQAIRQQWEAATKS
ncbi:MAG: CerR family C-terminal domain-containing protein [Uliginosibacterium sp.]|jgi:AcrR family transcriptional regulator|nr:CerR family C-terminal domain-containing protein [Uliginosibacterium sp.]